MSVAAVEIDFAQRHCRELTRRAAANFYYGIRLLPRDKRDAMCAVYAFARRVDDIGDAAGLAEDERLARLASERRVLDALSTDRVEDVEDPVAVALVHATRTFGLPVDALSMLIDGVELDIEGASYETFDDLVLYCRDVAGSIGRLCLAIFRGPQITGRTDDAKAFALADDLGVAMQLTNILRDVREDADRGRVYLPAADLGRLGVDDLFTSPPDVVAELVRFEAARAERWFERGLGLLEYLDPRSTSCVLAMTGIYREILRRIIRSPLEILHTRLSLAPWEKALVAVRCLATRPDLPSRQIAAPPVATRPR